MLHKRPTVNLFVRCHPPILPPSNFFQDDKPALEIEGRKEGEYFTANLPSDSLTSVCTTHPFTCQLIFKQLVLLICIEVFDLRISDSTITVCQSAQCQRRKLPPHPNPPRNPPARQDSSNQKFDFFDQKSLRSEFPRVSIRGELWAWLGVQKEQPSKANSPFAPDQANQKDPKVFPQQHSFKKILISHTNCNHYLGWPSYNVFPR